jgi:hypothetical protein
MRVLFRKGTRLLFFVLIGCDAFAMRFGLLKESKLSRQIQLVEHCLHFAQGMLIAGAPRARDAFG